MIRVYVLGALAFTAMAIVHSSVAVYALAALYEPPVAPHEPGPRLLVAVIACVYVAAAFAHCMVAGAAGAKAVELYDERRRDEQLDALRVLDALANAPSIPARRT